MMVTILDRDPTYAEKRMAPLWNAGRFCVYCSASRPGPDNVFEHTKKCRMNPANYRRFSRWRKHLTEGLEVEA